MHHKVQLINQVTGKPAFSDWSPTITPEEMMEANRGLAAKQLPWRWVLAVSAQKDTY